MICHRALQEHAPSSDVTRLGSLLRQTGTSDRAYLLDAILDYLSTQIGHQPFDLSLNTDFFRILWTLRSFWSEMAVESGRKDLWTKAYYPYCAYNAKCSFPPPENRSKAEGHRRPSALQQGEGSGLRRGRKSCTIDAPQYLKAGIISRADACRNSLMLFSKGRTAPASCAET